jgi:hypothetical protein
VCDRCHEHAPDCIGTRAFGLLGCAELSSCMTELSGVIQHDGVLHHDLPAADEHVHANYACQHMRCVLRIHPLGLVTSVNLVAIGRPAVH